MNLKGAHGEDDGRLGVLDAFRAIAILGVLVHHYLSRYAPPDHVPSLYGYAHRYPQWLDLGAMGVQFFFIISGFVIFMTLQRCNHLREFWVRRLARLYPAYVCAAALTFMVANLIGPPEFHTDLRDFLVGLTFMTNYVPGAHFVERAYWSLVVEMQFYVCIGIVFALWRRHFIQAWTAFSCIGTVLFILGRVTPWYVLGSISRQVLLAAYVPYFTAGIVFYRLYSRRRGVPVERAETVWLTVISIAASAEYVVSTAATTAAHHLVVAAMLVMFVLFIRGWLEWLAIRPLLLVGAVSYPLYMLHQYIGVSLIPYLTRLHLPDLVCFAAVTAACIAMAYAFTRWIERPAKRLILQYARRRNWFAPTPNSWNVAGRASAQRS
jgi:peptidoglycan/LPS O-acetylase OafA/YrhL